MRLILSSMVRAPTWCLECECGRAERSLARCYAYVANFPHNYAGGSRKTHIGGHAVGVLHRHLTAHRLHARAGLGQQRDVLVHH